MLLKACAGPEGFDLSALLAAADAFDLNRQHVVFWYPYADAGWRLAAHDMKDQE